MEEIKKQVQVLKDYVITNGYLDEPLNPSTVDAMIRNIEEAINGST